MVLRNIHFYETPQNYVDRVQKCDILWVNPDWMGKENAWVVECGVMLALPAVCRRNVTARDLGIFTQDPCFTRFRSAMERLTPAQMEYSDLATSLGNDIMHDELWDD